MEYQERTQTDIDLFKHISQEFMIRILVLLKNMWDGDEPPENWLKTIIIPVCNKGNIFQTL
jgi:hypothetical protein